jgi:hypothetical protein
VKNFHLGAQAHDYGYSKRKFIYPFFAHSLDLNTGRVAFNPSVDESFVTILPQNQLEVYTEDHPVPEDALKGNEAVMDYLEQFVDLKEFRN